jgi:outer membrane biogenesis lipoprotein LolB
MRKFKSITVLVVLMFLLSACAGWRGAAVANYETGSKTLKLYKDQAAKACDTKLVTPENCQKLKDAYNKARKPYVLAGDALNAAIETEDAVQQNTWKLRYEELINSYTTILLEFINVGYDVGIFTKGGKP